MAIPRADSGFATFWRLVIEQSWIEFAFGKISMLLVMSLAIERWFAVVKPIQYRYKFTKRRVYIYLVFILVAALSFRIHELLPNYNPQGISSQYLVTVEVVLTSFIPLLVIWTTIVHLWYHCRSVSNVQRTRFRNVKQKLLRMSALIASFITVCWLPAEIEFVISLETVVSLENGVSNIFYMLAMSNSIFNPWVYYFTNKEYKKEFKRTFNAFAALFKCVPNVSSNDNRWVNQTAIPEQKGSVVVMEGTRATTNYL